MAVAIGVHIILYSIHHAAIQAVTKTKNALFSFKDFKMVTKNKIIRTFKI